MDRVGILVVSLLTLSGCSNVAASSDRESPIPPPPSLATPTQCGPDQVQVLRGGAATGTRILSLIDAAKREIDAEMYEFGRSDIADALIAAHDRGVEVTVIDDPSVDVTAVTAMNLRSHGVDVIDYPIRPLMIDHVKLLIVDQSIAVVGGINWGAQSFANHDFDAELQGPAVGNLQRVFDRDLVTSGRHADVPAPIPDSGITVAATLPMTEIHPLALALINSATASLELELYVLTDAAIVHAVERAQARGVQVRMLLDPSQRPSDPSAQELHNNGIDVRLYVSHGELLHAKAAIADGRHVLFGSANWSAGGFARNHEIDIDFADCPAVAGDLLASFNSDWSVAPSGLSGT